MAVIDYDNLINQSSETRTTMSYLTPKEQEAWMEIDKTSETVRIVLAIVAIVGLLVIGLLYFHQRDAAGMAVSTPLAIEQTID